MKTLVASFLVVVASLGIGRSFQDGGKGGAGKPNVPAAAAPDAFHPGPQHALLQKRVGTWDAVLIAPDGKGGEARTKGTLTTTKVADFHTADAFDGEFMGTKFVGHGMNGYCTVRQKYFTYWVDSMTSSPMTMYGDYDDKKRELSLAGECYGVSGTLVKCRTVTHYTDDDHATWTMYGDGPDGKEMQQVRIEYTRRR